MNLSVFDNMNVKPATKKSTLSVARAVNSVIGKTKIKSIKSVKKKIEGDISNLGTRGNYYKSIVNYLKLTGDDKLRDEYRKLLFSNQQEINKQPRILTKEEKNVDYNKGKKDFIKRLKDNDYKTSLLEFILSLYLLLPAPRRGDYFTIEYTETSKNIKDDRNYIVGKRQGKFRYAILFNQFKNVDKIGKQKFMIKNKDMIKVLEKKGLKEGERVYSKSRNQYTRDLKKITKQIFGEELTINNLRHLHNTTKFTDTKQKIKVIKEDAKFSAHSVATKLQHYVRDK